MNPDQVIDIDQTIAVDDTGLKPDEYQRINEEYKIWKKNTPFLYDTVVSHALGWPSLTCQWLPDMESPAGENFTKHRLILGTHTSRTDKDYLMLVELTLPRAHAGIEGEDPDVSGDRSKENSGNKGKRVDVLADYSETRGELGDHNPLSSARMRVIQRINHLNEVNRARYMPQNPNLIATKTVSGDVYVFDRTRHSSEPGLDGVCRPDMKLKGQKKEGYGLSWSTLRSGHLLSASDDTTVCHWDTNSYKKGSGHLDPLRTYSGHTAVVEDVDWHAEDVNMFASVGDDKKLMIWDTRSDNASKASQEVEGHEEEVNAVAWSSAAPNLLLTGSGDNTVALWDIRRLDMKLHSFEAHHDEVLQVAWSPHDPTVFASSSTDRRVHLWDVSKIGEEQTPDDAEDGPPELLFVHGGHSNRPTDLSWCPNPEKRFHLVTTAEDNVAMVWQPSRNIYGGDDLSILSQELESETE